MLTRRGLGMLAVAGALWLASQAFGAPELQIAAAAMILLLVLATLMVWLSSNRLRVERLVHPARMAFGDRGSVTLTVTNLSWRPTARLELQDVAPPPVADPAPVSLSPLGARRRVELSYRLRGEQRGVYELGPLHVASSDPFALLVRRQILPGASPITVLPRIVELAQGLPLGAASGGQGEGRPRPQAGGEDLAEVREYVPGDPLKAIHWPSTAHRGKLMVRHEESPQDPRATVLLDLRSDRHRGHGPGSSLETAVNAAASVTVHLAARGQGVALVDAPGSGPVRAASSDAWLDHLAQVTATTVELRALVEPMITGGFVGSVLVAVITPPEGGDLQALVRAGRRASVRVALLVDTAAHDPSGRRPAPDLDLAARGLDAAGWRVAVLGADDDLASRWSDLLRVRRTSGLGA